MKRLKVAIVVDNQGSWMKPYANKFAEKLSQMGYDAKFYGRYADIEAGDIAVFLSCEKLVPEEVLKKNRHNLVVHESDLPAGKGWSPLTWQVLEGKGEIPITLFEAAEKVDSGQVYYKDKIKLEGHELIDEIREKQAQKTFELIERFLHDYPNVKGKEQAGEESFYRRRQSEDSQLNVEKSIAEQFDLLRVVDNERYPAFFYYRGKKYLLKVCKGE